MQPGSHAQSGTISHAPCPPHQCCFCNSESTPIACWQFKYWLIHPHSPFFICPFRHDLLHPCPSPIALDTSIGIDPIPQIIPLPPPGPRDAVRAVLHAPLPRLLPPGPLRGRQAPLAWSSYNALHQSLRLIDHGSGGGSRWPALFLPQPCYNAFISGHGSPGLHWLSIGYPRRLTSLDPLPLLPPRSLKVIGVGGQWAPDPSFP